MKKYYIPEAKDFYLGFEFERWINNSWEKDSLQSGRHLDEALDFEEGEENVRINYLDYEDIENASGFRLDREKTFISRGSYYNHEDNEHTLYHRKEGNKIIVGNKYGDVLFRGCIRNKSEFKTLLIWLEIVK